MDFDAKMADLTARLFAIFSTDATLVKSRPVATAPTEAAQGFSKRAGRVVASSVDSTPAAPVEAERLPIRASAKPVAEKEEGGRKLLSTQITLDTEPAAGDQIVLGDDTYTVVSFKTVKPKGTAFLFVAEVE